MRRSRTVRAMAGALSASPWTQTLRAVNRSHPPSRTGTWPSAASVTAREATSSGSRAFFARSRISEPVAELLHGFGNRLRERVVLGAHHVEHPVRLHVFDSGALRCGERLKRADLV